MIPMINIIAVLTVALTGRTSFAQSTNWAKLAEPKALSCSHNGATFEIIYNGAIIFTKMFPSYGWVQAENLVNACMAARSQALGENKAVFVNIEEGTVLPENGFFKRPEK